MDQQEYTRMNPQEATPKLVSFIRLENHLERPGMGSRVSMVRERLPLNSQVRLTRYLDLGFEC